MAIKPAKNVVEIPSTGINCVRNVYLWCMSTIYLFAFGSFYYQVPGLYGDNGLMPAKLLLKPVGRTFERNFSSRLTLVWLAPMLGLDVQLTVELIALAGMALAFVMLLSRKLLNMVTFATLWIFYLSLYQVGQTFTWFQWDILLLEAGFITIFVSPLHLLGLNSGGRHYHNNISLWLVKWLLFRLMFAAGVVKLTSLCPTWWQLTALNHHFESQCIPTPLAWYAHQLPTWILKLGVVGTYVVESAVPFLFFSPIRSQKLFSFYAQLLLQFAIILTGNYNFFNLLTIVLCIPLLDDQHLTRSSQSGKKHSDKKQKSQSSALSFVASLLSRLLEFATYSALIYWTCALFTVRLTPERTLESKIAFTSQEFHAALEKALLASIYIGALSLGATVLMALYRTARYAQGCFGKPLNLIYCLALTGFAFWIFAISMVPHVSVDKQLSGQVWPVITKWHASVDQYQLVNPYGLFRRMTGTKGRPEVVIEGSNSMTSGWKEYHFVYKPGNLTAAPPIVAPHQPRLDWQMWFAALGTYQENPWFLSLVNRLLNGQSEVLDLLDKSRNPFPNQPPKFIRATSYLYHYTPWSKRTGADWWTRKKVGEYLPALNKDHPSLKEYLQKNNLVEVERRPYPVKNLTLKKVLVFSRQWICQMSAPILMLALFTTGYTVKILTSWLRRSGNR